MKAFRNWLGPALCLGVVVTGCSVGPSYRRPAALGARPLPTTFGAGENYRTNEWRTAQPSAHLPRGAWWSLFQDPELNRLEALASSGNQEVVAALARLALARAQVDVARSQFFPHINAVPSYTRQSTSANQVVLGHPAGAIYTYGTLTVPLEANWELDLWGRVRRQTEAAHARLTASADDVEAARLAIEAEVATDYFTLRALDADYELLQRTVETYQRSLELTRNRRRGGVATDLDVTQAETQLRATEAQLPATDLQRKRLRHALAVLSGEAATGFVVQSSASQAQTVPTVPVSLPSELLERRPDIAAAERRMAAANADVGVAQSAFYPRVQLGGLAGLQSIDAGTLFNWPSRFWAVGPSLDLPIFTGGQLRAQLAANRAAYQETLASYRQVVLTAFQEVEDQLAAQHLIAAQLEAQTAALASAQRTLEVANNRYKAGLVTYLEVATAQTSALQQERAVVQLRGERFATSVALIRAMGGGWEPPASNSIRQAQFQRH